MRTILGSVFALLFLSACTSSEGSEDGGPDLLNWTAAPAITLQENARITEPMFGVINTMRSTPTGDVVVGDWTTSSFSVLDAEGSLRYSFGKEGEGPGEFRYLPSLILDSDSIYTIETWPLRMSAWAPGESQPTRIQELDGSLGSTVVSKHGELHVFQKSKTYSPGSDPDEERTVALSLWDASNGERKDSLVLLPEAERAVVSTESTISVRGLPFGGNNLFARAAEGRLVHAWTKTPEISIYGPSLDLERTIRIQVEPVAFTRRDLDDYMSEYPDMEAAMRRAVTDLAPDFWPPIEQLIVDDLNRLWIGVATPPGEDRQWVVGSIDGEVLGRTTLPEDLVLHIVRDDVAFGVYPEDLDAGGPVIVRYEVSY